MKTIQYVFNLFYYHIFLTAKAFNNSFNSLFLPLYRLKIMRRRCQKYGIEDSYEWAKKRFESENYQIKKHPVFSLSIGKKIVNLQT